MFGKKVGDFLAGRGFYIVLMGCIAVIGVSAWSLVLNAREGDGYYVDYSLPSAVESTQSSEVFAPKSTALPSQTPAPSSAAVQVPPYGLTATPSPLPTPSASVSPLDEALSTAAPTEEPKADTHATATDVPPRESEKPQKTIADLVFVKPVAGEISQEYSVDALVYSRTLGDWRTHAGIDLAAALGTKVQAACDGTVTEIREDNMLGTTVVIDHGLGLVSVYSNLAAQPAVAVGDNVAAGAVIGSVGSTALGESGEVTHLHFAMMLDGENVDPTQYVK